MTADLSKIQRLIILFGVLSVAAAGWSFYIQWIVT